MCMEHNQQVSWVLATFMLMALGRHHLQTVVPVFLWLIIQVCKADSSQIMCMCFPPYTCLEMLPIAECTE